MQSYMVFVFFLYNKFILQVDFNKNNYIKHN